MLRPNGNTLASVLEEKALAAPAHPAILFENRSISYGELLERTTQVAKALIARGVRRGDRIGVLIGNDPDWVVMAMAASMLGVGFAPLNTWYKKNELGWIIRHCNLSLVVCVRQFLKTDYGRLFTELIPELNAAAPDDLRTQAWPTLRNIVFIGEPVPGGMDWPTFLRGADSISGPALLAARSLVAPDTTAFILYTSGSTAEPKGVLLNHRGVVSNGFDIGQRRGIVADDRVWIGTSLFYALGATNALPATITAGATMVLQGYFEPGTAIDVVRRTGSTVYYGTGNMTRAMLDHPDYTIRKVGSLKKGNAGTVAEYKRLALVEMQITGAATAYGLTETYGNATVGMMDEPLEIKLSTNGCALPGMELIIVDPVSGTPLPRGETGLVLVRGHTTPGYLEASGGINVPHRSDGFFDTGDLGSLDSDGRMIFHSRLKEVIKSSGINVSPVEVEQLLAGHPDVRDAYVVGVGHPVRGELIVAFVDVLNPVSESSLREYLRERAASFKVPHHILFRRDEQLPRLGSGKVAKHKLSIEARLELGL